MPDLHDYNLANAAEKLEIERLAGLFENSKPSIIKVGRFGLFSRFERDRSLSKSLIPNPERPRIYISGTVFGSEPRFPEPVLL